MHFKINQDFAKNYNRYRQKEEYEKLKAKHGDKLKDIKLSNLTDADLKPDKDNALVSDDDDESTSSISSDTDVSWEEKQQDDFLNLYQALCTNDPSLNDPNKQWFREPSESSDDSSSKSTDEISDSEISKNNNTQKQMDVKRTKKHVLKLRDYEREFLLTQNGLEDETVSKEAEKIAQMESDDVLKKLEKQSTDLSKKQFILEANEALNQAAIISNEMKDNRNSDSDNDDLNFLRKRKSEIESPTSNKKKRKCQYDLDKIVFTNSSNKEAEEFLRDYILNKRWIEPNSQRNNKIPTYSDILQESGLDANGDQIKNLLNDDDILDEDDEFLVKANNFEQERLQSLGVNMGVTKLHKTQHRFEEEDKEFIKSYPRIIENSIGQTLCVKSRRAERRQAKIERKRKEKKAKLQELTRLRNLKLSMLAEKIERIKRTCGPGSLLLDANDLMKSQATKCDDNSSNELKTSSKVDVLDVAEYLDDDWDPEKHEKLLNSMFGKEYEEIDEEIKKPEFSDESDLEMEPSSDDKRNSPPKKHKSKSCNNDSADNTPPKQSGNMNPIDTLSTANGNNKTRRGKRQLFEALERNKPIFNPDDYPDFEKYFEEFYQLHCEDIIPGPTPDEDVYCRFKYRNVLPNDFGLSTEEILKADTKELNAWVSLKRITAYLSPDEELKDQELYSSNYQLKRKMAVLGSLNNPNATWYPNKNEEIESNAVSKKKRRRHKKKKGLDSGTQEVELNGDDNDDNNNHENNSNNDSVKQNDIDSGNGEKPMKLKKKKYVADACKLNKKDIFKSRLQAAGITLKEYHRTMQKKKRCRSEGSNE